MDQLNTQQKLEFLTLEKYVGKEEALKIFKIKDVEKVDDVGKEIIEQYNKSEEEKSKINKNNVIKKLNNIINIKNNDYITTGIIVSQPQSKKTKDGIITIMENCIKNKIPVIITCGNGLSILDQTYKRIVEENNLDCMLLKANNTNFHSIFEHLLEKNKLFVVCGINHHKQVERVYNIIYNFTSRNFIKYDKICIIHDEGDTILQDKENKIVTKNTPKTQAEHTKFFNFHIEHRAKEMKIIRYFVSATPENCLIAYNIKCKNVIQFKLPTGYSGYEKFNWVNMENNDIDNSLIQNINRLNEDKQNGVIIITSDKKCILHYNMLKKYGKKHKTEIVLTYEGPSIKISTENEEFEKHLCKYLIDYNIKKWIKNGEEKIIKLSDMAIAEVLQICKEFKETIKVIVIGYDLIARANTICSIKKEKNTLTAVGMILLAAKTTHLVALNQRIGRLGGMARPDQERFLYCSKDIWDNYKSYNDNQQIYLKEIEKEENKELFTKDVIIQMKFKSGINHPLDRPKLGIENIYNYPRLKITSNNEEVNNEDAMKRLINMWSNKNNNTCIARMFKFLLHKKGENKDIIISKLQEYGSSNPQDYYIHMIRIEKDKYHGYVFRRENDNTYIKKEAMDYYNSIVNIIV